MAYKHEDDFGLRPDMGNNFDNEFDNNSENIKDGDGDYSEEPLELSNFLDDEEQFTIEELEPSDYEDNREARSVDAVSAVSEYYHLRKRHDAKTNWRKQYGEMTKEELFHAMRQECISEKERLWLRDEIFFQVFFLLLSVVKKNYRISSHLFNDMMQNMSHMLLVAINMFDPSKGFKFTSYLAGYLKSGMTRAFRDTNVVSVPTGRRKLLQEMQAKMEVCPNEIVSYTGIEYDNNGSAGSPKINFEELVHNKELKEWLEDAISREAGLCSDDERMILTLHYGLFGVEKKSYREIAEIRKKGGRSSSFSRISQIHARALEKLRQYFMERHIEEF